MKKKYGIVLVLMLIAPFLIAWSIISNNEVYWPQKQKFEKPVIEKDSKLGPWLDSPNMGSVDPKNYVMFMDDFTAQNISVTANANIWLAAKTGTIEDSGPGGLLKLMTTYSDETMNMQVNGESFQIQKNKPLYFETRFSTSVSTSSPDWFVGLMSTDTEYFNSATTILGFMGGETSTESIYGIVKSASVEYTIDTGQDLVSGTQKRLGFTIDNTVSAGITMYVDDSPVAKPCTAGICSQFLSSSLPLYVSPAIAIQSKKQCTGYLDVDYIKVIQKR